VRRRPRVRTFSHMPVFSCLERFSTDHRRRFPVVVRLGHQQRLVCAHEGWLYQRVCHVFRQGCRNVGHGVPSKVWSQGIIISRVFRCIPQSLQVASVESETVDTKKADLKPGAPSGSDSFRDMSAILRLVALQYLHIALSMYNQRLRFDICALHRLAKGSDFEMSDGLFGSPNKKPGCSSVAALVTGSSP
jgi:hypothetical protein